MKTVNVHEAKTTVSALLQDVENGEDVVIACNGTPIAKLACCMPARQQLEGSWRSLPG